jgi:hypothetical protein
MSVIQFIPKTAEELPLSQHPPRYQRASVRVSCLPDSWSSSAIRASLQNGRGLPLTQPSPLRKRRQSHIFTYQNDISVARARRPNGAGWLQLLIRSAPWRLCARIWVGGNEAFAPEVLVPSCLWLVKPTDRRARRPHFFRFALIRVIRGPV